ncbi:MAG: protein TolQ [Deltaproteobacteria bacterium]|nr:protein TolQ [Deltaproteobacteria bacterium]
MNQFLLVLGSAERLSPWALFWEASLVVKVVMFLLIAMSVVGWYIIGYKYLFIARAAKESDVFMEAFWRSKDVEAIYKSAQELSRSPLSHLFLAAYSELAKLQRVEGAERDRDGDLENVERALIRAQVKETTMLESMVPFLATTGSAAPFIGLFGTVVGIMNSFRSIGAMKSASVQTVAPGIAEALFATAIGLVAAIPAVMAYNYFLRRIRVLTSEMETFSKDFLNIVRRHFLK